VLTSGCLGRFLKKIRKKLTNLGCTYVADSKYHIVEREDGSYYYQSDDGNIIEPFS
jgi:hypothetical protein